MKNQLFTPEHIALLSDVARWRIIASGLPDEVEPVRDPKHEKWARRHLDVHSHREAIIVLNGAGHDQLNGKTYPTSPGSIILFDAMEEHYRAYPPWQTPREMLLFCFLPDLVQVSCLRSEQGRQNGIYVGLWKQIYPLSAIGLLSAHLLFPSTNAKAPPEAKRQRCLGMLNMLVSSVIERSYQPQSDSPEEDLQRSVVTAIVRHIQQTYGRNCSLDNLARLAGYSRSHFSRLFAKHSGMSLPACISAARAVGFQKMLSEGKPLKTISVELGFSHPSVLSRWRRQQGI